MLGNFYIDQHQDSKAEREFMRVLSKDPNDSYAHTSIGNIIYRNSCRYRDNPQKQEEKLREALKKYLKAMECDDSNAFAAVGIANIIGEYGMTIEASEMYRVIRENHINIPHAMINAAHILASEGQVLSALRYYEKTLEKFYNGKNPQIEMWIARLYYQTKRYDECEKQLKSIIKRNPSDFVGRFNLALCLQAKCIEILNKDFRAVSETKKTIANLNIAKSIFSGLIKNHNSLSNMTSSRTKSEAADELKTTFSRILKVSDERLFFIKDTSKNSWEEYLRHDMEQERLLQLKQEENARLIKELEDKEEQIRLEQLKKEEEERLIREKKAEESNRMIEVCLILINFEILEWKFEP